MYIGAVREEPGVVKGEIRIRHRVMIGVTVDHRIVNGGPGARFLNEVRSSLENPSRLLLSL
jgi:pyruvate dehydrogenase E2 component (dihydrolipoamide acetyltransferase)